MPVTRRPDQPWYHSLTIDLLIRILNNSIFHPFVAALIPLTLCAGGIAYWSNEVKNTIYWAIFICILHALAPLNERLAYGKPRHVEEEEEVIVVTGGGSGLGKCLVETYAMKGGTVAVLDVQVSNKVESARYFKCDVSDPIAVETAWAMIKKELGVPTVLINCAGLVHGKTMMEMTAEDVTRSFAVNTISHYHLTKLFVSSAKDSPYGGTVVTISSVLAKLGVAQLSAYSATKAALNAYHSSVTAELVEYPNIKTILVATGQLSTDMFKGLEHNAIKNFFGPIVEVSDLAMKIVRMISEGRGGLIAEPAYARWISTMEILPFGVQSMLRYLVGVHTAMQSFQGKSIKD